MILVAGTYSILLSHWNGTNKFNIFLLVSFLSSFPQTHRDKLEHYEQSCAVDSVTKKCAGKTTSCRKALIGILGTPLRTSCACQGTDLSQLYDCLGWQRLLWLNPCVGEWFKWFQVEQKTKRLIDTNYSWGSKGVPCATTDGDGITYHDNNSSNNHYNNNHNNTCSNHKESHYNNNNYNFPAHACTTTSVTATTTSISCKWSPSLQPQMSNDNSYLN